MSELITIYHNPACTTSRKTLALIRAAGREPVVTEYLVTGWTLDQLRGLLSLMGIRPRDLMRVRGTPAAELGLLAPDIDDERILAAMVAHPILVERPIVVTPRGALVTRPPERVAALLEGLG